VYGRPSRKELSLLAEGEMVRALGLEPFIIDDVKKALLTLTDLDVHRRDGKDKSDDLVFAKSDNNLTTRSGGRRRWLTPVSRTTDGTITAAPSAGLVQAGVHLKVVQEAAGHATIASIMGYAHFAPSQVVDAMLVLD
jgi:hypothetical protein